MKVTFRCLPELEGLLPRPIPARRGLPQWLKDMPMAAHSPDAETTVKTVKKCPPFLDAMQSGFLIPLPCDIEVRDGAFEWDWRELPSFPRHTPRSPLSFHVAAQVVDTPLFAEDTIFIKFQNLWTIETEPGYSLLVSHPVNRLDLPFRSLTGLVDSDDFGSFAVLVSALGDEAMAHFLDETLAPIIEHDKTRKGSLLSCAEAFLKHGCRYQAAADALGVHVSTLRYRLKRLSELFGLDLDSNEDDRFALSLALRIHELRN